MVPDVVSEARNSTFWTDFKAIHYSRFSTRKTLYSKFYSISAYEEQKPSSVEICLAENNWKVTISNNWQYLKADEGSGSETSFIFLIFSFKKHFLAINYEGALSIFSFSTKCFIYLFLKHQELHVNAFFCLSIVPYDFVYISMVTYLYHTFDIVNYKCYSNFISLQ